MVIFDDDVVWQCGQLVGRGVGKRPEVISSGEEVVEEELLLLLLVVVASFEM